MGEGYVDLNQAGSAYADEPDDIWCQAQGPNPPSRRVIMRSCASSSLAHTALPMSCPGFPRRRCFRCCRRCRHPWMAAFSFSPIAQPPLSAMTW